MSKTIDARAAMQTSPPKPVRSVKVIVAYSRNRVIGRDNTLPWRLPNDLKHFKQQTLGCPVIMGRKTWESLGRPLPGRQNVVISRFVKAIDGAVVATSLEHALELAGNHPTVFIIGGAQLYQQSLDQADEVIATEIDTDIEGDAHFPVLDPQTWKEVDRQVQPEENGLRYAFVTYRKKP